MSRPLVATQVVRVIRRELEMVRDRPDSSADDLLRLADQLLARAALDDAVVHRRSEAPGSGTDMRAIIDVELGGTTSGSEPPDGDTSTSFESAAPPSLAEADIVDAFDRGAPDLGIRSVTRLRRISGGFSKETIRADVVDTDDRATDVVIRKVAPGRRADGLRPEFDVISAVGASSCLPAPRPMWLLEDCAGTPAFAATGLPGGLLGTVWGWTATPPETAFLDLGRVMGQLHAIDAAAVPVAPLPPLSTHQDHLDAIAERAEVLATIWDGGEDTFRPAFELVLNWLRHHAPQDAPTQVLVHGDFGLHNILFENGRLTGLLDWERAHRGNPAEDLAYLKPSLDQVDAWPTFLEGYREAGGPALVTHDLDYFTVWQDMWRAVSSYRVRAKFLAEPTQLSDSISGLLMTPRFLARAARRVLDHCTEDGP